MIRTLEAVVEGGKGRLLEVVDDDAARRALVTILDETPRNPIDIQARRGEAGGLLTLLEQWIAEYGDRSDPDLAEQLRELEQDPEQFERPRGHAQF